MGQTAPKPAAIAVALLFALSVFGFTLFVWKSFGGPVPLEPKGYRFHVLFGADASNLVAGAEARISGVEVGRVAKVERRFDRTEAEIEVESKFAPISTDTRAIARSKTLLGETFIELSPGSASDRRLPDGGTLPRGQVGQAQGLDEVLGAFDEPTRDALKAFLRDLSASLKGRGEDFNAGLGNLAPTLDDLQRLVIILDNQRPAVQRLIADGGDALNAVGRREAAVQSLVTAGDDVLSATASRDRDLTATIEAMPAFLSRLRSSLTEAEAAAADAAPTLSALRPVAPLVRPALDELSGLVRNVVPLSREIGPVIDNAKRGLPSATRVVEAAGPLLDQLNPAGRELVPSLRYIGAFRKDMVASLANVAAASQATTTQPGGKRQHYLRILPPFLSDVVLGYDQRLASNRANPYREPGGPGELATGGLSSFSCANTANPQITPALGGTPRCVQAKPWSFGGISRQFPHVERDP